MILVTGGTGLVGSYLLLELCSRGIKVKALKRRISSFESVKKLFAYNHPDKPRIYENITWVEGDVTDYLSLEYAMHDVTEVYHCAAMVSFDPRDRRKLIEINAEGTANVVNAALKLNIRKLCYVSSVAAIGREAENLMINEASQWVDSPGNSVYAVSKYAAEREVWRGIEEGLNAVIVNPSIIIGAGDGNKSSVQLLKRAFRGNPFYTKGINAFVDVRDVVAAMILLMNSDISGKRFILTAENRSYKDLFDLMADGFGKKRPWIHVKPWIFTILWRLEWLRSIVAGSQALLTRETAYTAHRSYTYSSALIRSKTGFQFRDLATTINDHCKAFASLQQKNR